jgi:hypothetical protein
MMRLKVRQAAVAAADRLEANETWSRRSFITLLVIAHLTAVPAVVFAYGACEYMRIKFYEVTAKKAARDRVQAERP